MATDCSLSSVEDMKGNSSLFYHLQVFLYDIKHFRSDEGSKIRLQLLCDETFIGEPYFNEEEAKGNKHCSMAECKDLQTTISNHIAEKLKRREESGVKDFEICAAHDLAPIFERAFGIRGKDLQGNKAFKKKLRKDGLQFAKG